MTLFKLQRYSAIALLVFLTIHMIVVHYPPFHIDFSRIIVRMGQPIWKAIDIAFLLSVLIHGLAGAYAVLTDWDKISATRRALATAFVVLGVVAFIYGTMTILAFDPALAIKHTQIETAPIAQIMQP
jgi:succinate dehydrogenase hydrophobic anchor subunit